VYRQEWTGLTEPQVVPGALECLEELSWIRPEAVRAPDVGRPTRARRGRPPRRPEPWQEHSQTRRVPLYTALTIARCGQIIPSPP